MKLGFPLWKQVLKVPRTLNRLSWPWLLKSRIGKFTLDLNKKDSDHSGMWPNVQ